MESVLRLAYTYSGNDWYSILSPLTQNPDIEVKLYSKFVACHVVEALPQDQLSPLLELNKADVDALIMLCTTSPYKDRPAQFRIPLSCKDIVNTTRVFLTYGDNQGELLNKLPFNSFLSAMLVNDNEVDRKAACKLLLDAQLSPPLKEVMALPQSMFDRCEPADIWMQTLKGSFDPDGLFSNIVPSLSERLISTINELDDNQLTRGMPNSSLVDMLDVMLKLSSSELSEGYPSQELIEALYHLTSRVFDGKVTCKSVSCFLYVYSIHMLYIYIYKSLILWMKNCSLTFL